MKLTSGLRSSALAVSIAALGLGAVSGCHAPRHATFAPTRSLPDAPRPPAHVEVLLDREPDRAFSVVGVLTARAVENPQSVEMMRREAERAGLDGIYWIECTSVRSGACTARGYLYDRPRPAIEADAPEVAAK